MIFLYLALAFLAGAVASGYAIAHGKARLYEQLARGGVVKIPEGFGADVRSVLVVPLHHGDAGSAPSVRVDRGRASDSVSTS